MNMRYLIVALILIFVSPANAGVKPKPSEEFCKPIRDSVITGKSSRGGNLYDAPKLVMLNDEELLCFNEATRKTARTDHSIRFAIHLCSTYQDACQDQEVDLPSSDNPWFHPQNPQE